MNRENNRSLGRRLLMASVAITLPLALAQSAGAQTSTPQTAPERASPQGAPPTTTPPPAAKPSDPAAAPSSGEMSPTTPNNSKAATPPAATTADTNPKATVKDVAIGTAVYDSAGQKIGEVNGIKSDSGGVVEELHVKTGGLFGLGSKVLVVPGAKIAKGGKSIQLALSSADFSKLPVLPNNKG